MPRRLRGERDDLRSKRIFVETPPRHIPLGFALLAEQTSGKALRDTKLLLNVLDTSAATGRTRKFSETAHSQDQLLKREIRHNLPQPLILLLQLLEPLHWLVLSPLYALRHR